MALQNNPFHCTIASVERLYANSKCTHHSYAYTAKFPRSIETITNPGKVCEQSDRRGEKPTSRPVRIGNKLYWTIEKQGG